MLDSFAFLSGWQLYGLLCAVLFLLLGLPLLMSNEWACAYPGN